LTRAKGLKLAGILRARGIGEVVVAGVLDLLLAQDPLEVGVHADLELAAVGERGTDLAVEALHDLLELAGLTVLRSLGPDRRCRADGRHRDADARGRLRRRIVLHRGPRVDACGEAEREKRSEEHGDPLVEPRSGADDFDGCGRCVHADSPGEQSTQTGRCSPREPQSVAGRVDRQDSDRNSEDSCSASTPVLRA
jgi:hypothetical protein